MSLVENTPSSPRSSIAKGAVYNSRRGFDPGVDEMYPAPSSDLHRERKHGLLDSFVSVEPGIYTRKEKGDDPELSHALESPDYGQYGENSSKGDEEYCKLEKDIFNLLFISDRYSWSFFYSILVFCFQLVILLFITIDLLKDDAVLKDENVLNLPVNVHWQVSSAQVMALVIAVASQDDLRTTLSMVRVGYRHQMLEEFPGATRTSWIVSNACRFLEGTVTVFVVFVFVVQSDNVLDIFMNFAAVEFISHLDNLAFELALSGYMGRKIRNDTRIMKDLVLPITRPRLRWLSRGVLYFILLGLLGGWAVIRARQANGFLLEITSCSSFTVSFGEIVYEIPKGAAFALEGSFRENRPQRLDRNNPPDLFYSYFSGTYLAGVTRFGGRWLRQNNRPVYFERGIDDPASGLFYYCDDEKAWAFTIPALGDAIPQSTRTSKCEAGWLVISPVTAAYRLEDVQTDGWQIWTGSLAAAEEFSVQCNECQRDADCSLIHGRCNTGSGVCECFDGWSGISCHVEQPYCEEIVWIDFGESSWEYLQTTPYQLFHDGGVGLPLVYDRPVYRQVVQSSNSATCGGDGILEELIFYTGRRWYDSVWCPDERDAVFDGAFHAFWDDVLSQNTLWFSDTTDSQVPTGFKWNEIRSSSSAGEYGPFGATFPVNAVFECMAVDCEKDNICGYYGTCQDGVCSCNEYYGGHFCEFEPGKEYTVDQWNAFSLYLQGYNPDYENADSFGYGLNQYHQLWWSSGGSPGGGQQAAGTSIAVRVDLQLDDYPGETSWSISTSSGEVVVSFEAGYFTTPAVLDSRVVYLIPGAYTFTIGDTQGDGLCCRFGNGGYNIYAALPGGDVLLATSNGMFTDSETQTLQVSSTRVGIDEEL